MLKHHRVVGGHQLELLGSEAFSLPEIFERSGQVHMWCTRFNRLATSTTSSWRYTSHQIALKSSRPGDLIVSLRTSLDIDLNLQLDLRIDVAELLDY